MRWPRIFADATYRNPHIWTWRDWIFAFALLLATLAVLTVLVWPIAMLLIGR